MYIEGHNVVMEAVKSNIKIKKFYIQDSLQKDYLAIITKYKNSVEIKSKNELDKLSKTKHHQGVIAEISDYTYTTVEDILQLAKDKKEDPFLIILDGIEDPHNLGSIIRVADCVGAHGIILSKNRCAQVTETVYKTSAGAVNHIKIARVTNINYTIDDLKNKYLINIFATDANGDDIYQTNISGPVAVIIGNEGKGISQLTLKKSDKILSIPLKGKVNSLNASVATSIVCYEILRQRLTY